MLRTIFVILLLCSISHAELVFEGTVWSAPTRLSSWSETWMINDTLWETYQSVRDDDLHLLRQNFNHSRYLTVILYFPTFLASEAHVGNKGIDRLADIIDHFHTAGTQIILFFGRPDFDDAGCSSCYADIVHDPSSRASFMQNMRRVLQDPRVQGHIDAVSVYWMGASHYCTSDMCTQDEIGNLTAALTDLIHQDAQVPHLVHVDGPFWEACQGDCTDLNVNGYSPQSLSEGDGVLGESWTQGTLKGGVNKLLQDSNFSPLNITLICDVPNCYSNKSNKECSTGSVEGDISTWFQWHKELGLRSWAVWNFVDGPIGGANDYGDVETDGSGLTRKGRVYSSYATPGPRPPPPPPPYPQRDWGWTDALTPLRSCNETKTWRELVPLVESGEACTGGLGAKLVPGLFEVWLCFQDHPCARDLQTLALAPHTGGDYSMCFVFNEQRKSWVPWQNGSKQRLCSQAPPSPPPSPPPSSPPSPGANPDSTPTNFLHSASESSPPPLDGTPPPLAP
mmetsp:Transcript_8161/g.18632  ORF Transcript_8161/g.18632 Transcript_8161/m.18632 type:complete len:508 (-) Transcript_8161:62-1585(-)